MNCPYCDEKYTESDIDERGEVKVSEYDIVVYYLICNHCHKRFRVIKTITVNYFSEKLLC